MKMRLSRDGPILGKWVSPIRQILPVMALLALLLIPTTLMIISSSSRGGNEGVVAPAKSASSPSSPSVGTERGAGQHRQGVGYGGTITSEKKGGEMRATQGNMSDPNDPFEVTNPVTFAMNASVPERFFKVYAGTLSENLYHGVFLNMSPSLDVDLAVYGNGGFSGDPYMVSQLAGSEPEMVMLERWNAPITDGWLYIKVTWKGGDGLATLRHAVSDGIIEPRTEWMAPKSPYILDSGAISLIAYNYSGGETFTFRIQLAGATGFPPEPVFLNFSVYFLPGNGNASDLVASKENYGVYFDPNDFERSSQGKNFTLVMSWPEMRANALVAMFVPISYAEGIEFSYDTVSMNSHGNLTATDYTLLNQTAVVTTTVTDPTPQLFIYHAGPTFNTFFVRTNAVEVLWEVFADANLSVLLHSEHVPSGMTTFYFTDDYLPLLRNPTGTNFYYLRVTPLTTGGTVQLVVDVRHAYLDATTGDVHVTYHLSASELGELHAVLMTRTWGFDVHEYDIYVVPELTLDVDVLFLDGDGALSNATVALMTEGKGRAEVQPRYTVPAYDVYFFVIVRRDGAGDFQLNLRRFHDNQAPVLNEPVTVSATTFPYYQNVTVDINASDDAGGVGIMNHTLEYRANASSTWLRRAPLDRPNGTIFRLPAGTWEARVLVFDYAENVLVLDNNGTFYQFVVTDPVPPTGTFLNLTWVSSALVRIYLEASDGTDGSGLAVLETYHSFDNVTWFTSTPISAGGDYYYIEVPVNESVEWVYVKCYLEDNSGNGYQSPVQGYRLKAPHFITIENVTRPSSGFFGSTIVINVTIQSSDPVSSVTVTYYYNDATDVTFTQEMTRVADMTYQAVIDVKASTLNETLLFFRIEAVNTAGNQTSSSWHEVTIVRRPGSFLTIEGVFYPSQAYYSDTVSVMIVVNSSAAIISATLAYWYDDDQAEVTIIEMTAVNGTVYQAEVVIKNDTRSGGKLTFTIEVTNDDGIITQSGEHVIDVRPKSPMPPPTSPIITSLTTTSTSTVPPAITPSFELIPAFLVISILGVASVRMNRKRAGQQ